MQILTNLSIPVKVQLLLLTPVTALLLFPGNADADM